MHDLKIGGTHIAFPGFSGAVQAPLGDQVHFICATVADVVELVRSGDFRLLAVTAEQRQSLLPDVPTMAEQGFADFNAASWIAYVASVGMPQAVIDRVQSALAVAVGDPGAQERLGKIGVTARPRSRADLVKFMQDEAARRWRVINENGIKVEN